MEPRPYYDLVIKSGLVAQLEPDGAIKFKKLDIGIVHNKIEKLGAIDSQLGKEVIDAEGQHVLPGAIDTQVHFREPGLEHKEDLFTGTKAAALGGVTTVFEMPNTSPPTTTAAELNRKLDLCNDRAWVNYAFYVGGSRENAAQLPELEKLQGCCGIKIFMGSSTGNLLVKDDDVLDEIFRRTKRRIALHCEDEARLNERKPITQATPSVHMHPVWRDEETALIATQKAVRLAEKYERPIHILHVTSQAEIEFLANHKKYVTVEVTPQHLTLYAPECYDSLDTFAQMNPPIREKKHFLALWKGLEAGVVDVIGSDHAPHTREEKQKGYPNTPSGMPGVQTLLPIMLNHVNEGRLTLEKVVQLTSLNPTRVFGIANKGQIREGFDADITIVNMKSKRTITNEWIASKCGWSPFQGKNVTGWPTHTIVNGKIVMRDDKVNGSPVGRPCQFN